MRQSGNNRHQFREKLSKQLWHEICAPYSYRTAKQARRHQCYLSCTGMCISAWILWLADINHQFVQASVTASAPGCRSRTLQDIQKAQKFIYLRTGGSFFPEFLLLLQECFQLCSVRSSPHLIWCLWPPVYVKKDTKKKQVGTFKQKCPIS